MFGSDYRRASCSNTPTENDAIIEPKRARNLDYNAAKSSLGTHPREVKLFPLEVRAVLDKEGRKNNEMHYHDDCKTASDCPKYFGRQCRIPRRRRSPSSIIFDPKHECTTTPDVYRNILGPTPDESILAGLQTVIDICGLIDDCCTDSEERIPPVCSTYMVPKLQRVPPKTPSREPSDPSEINGSYIPAKPETPRTEGSIDTFKTPNTSGTNTPYKENNKSPYLSNEDVRDTSPPPPEKSESPVQIKSNESTGNETISYDPTSSASLCKMDECCGTNQESLACVKVKARDGRDVCIKYRCTSVQSSLSAKCFPPVEIPPCNMSCGKCFIVNKGVEMKDLNIPIPAKSSCFSSTSMRRKHKDGREGKSVVVQDPRASVSLIFDPRFTCNKDYQRPVDRPHKDFRLCKNVRPAVQPVIGICSGKCGGAASESGGSGAATDADTTAATAGTTASVENERLLEVRYAIVRISVFSNYSTYEIMKSSKKKPKKLPESVEGIFVTKR